MYKEDYAAALARSGEAEGLFRKLGIEAYVAGTLHQQGLIDTDLARAAADNAEAARLRQAAFDRFTESLAIERRIGNEVGAADSLGELGKLLMGAGRMREAIEAFNECVKIYQCQGNAAKLGIMLECLGIVHERQGQLAAALEKYKQALELFKRYSSPQDVAYTERHIARVWGKMGNE